MSGSVGFIALFCNILRRSATSGGSWTPGGRFNPGPIGTGGDIGPGGGPIGGGPRGGGPPIGGGPIGGGPIGGWICSVGGPDIWLGGGKVCCAGRGWACSS